MHNRRILVVSGYAQIRRLLSDLVKCETGAAATAEAGNSVEAITLAKDLKPDVVLMDVNLPYKTGLDWVRLSRISGLDTAQTIAEETPNSLVIILNNLEDLNRRRKGYGPVTYAHLSTHRNGFKTSLTLQELFHSEIAAGAPVFANVEI